MGLIKAFSGAVGGTIADQWKDIIVPPSEMNDHIVFAAGVRQDQNNKRGSNGKASSNIISNGSLIVVPEGVSAVLMSSGAITSVVSEAGGFTYHDNDINSKSVYAGDGLVGSLIKQSWERFKFGGQPGAKNQVFYINMKEIAGLKYGTQNPIRYRDGMYGNQMLAVTSFGNYSVRVVDPLALVKNLIPVSVLGGTEMFKLEDAGVGETLFSGFIGSLAVALSSFTKGGKGIDEIQGGTVLFAKEINKAVEEEYQWMTNYGLEVVAVQPRGLDWDDASVELINKFSTGFLMQGNIGNAYAQTQMAEGMKAAGQNGGVSGVMGMGMTGGMFGGFMQQPMAQSSVQAGQQEDPMVVLEKYKTMLDKGLINQEEYNAKKEEVLSKM